VRRGKKRIETHQIGVLAGVCVVADIEDAALKGRRYNCLSVSGGVDGGGNAGDCGFDFGGIGGGVGDEDGEGEAAAVGEDDQADVVGGGSFAGLGAGCAGLSEEKRETKRKRRIKNGSKDPPLQPG